MVWLPEEWRHWRGSAQAAVLTESCLPAWASEDSKFAAEKWRRKGAQAHFARYLARCQSLENLNTCFDLLCFEMRRLLAFCFSEGCAVAHQMFFSPESGPNLSFIGPEWESVPDKNNLSPSQLKSLDLWPRLTYQCGTQARGFSSQNGVRNEGD
ncbi:hypothetical protein MPTK1_3g14740 [Marchantia polymorpha subsp. ruderalis]|uniref:Uncharacterized protein n=2 Tax=Marchantia polymorpha TaxID=3197 RepID=A0AAF6B0V6_MARPO|nr:hypothetical protein MARPO_0004s0197 [Marchantia polymorpha]BBN05640.1 hypothetical protein Mp_3g14740 [Marchantia polymorpha subsp. ruderalis]|eukprot:PTQ48942.1 hypothetical protein MARPO_0004s0197 [Marchantia polymorpha]